MLKQTMTWLAMALAAVVTTQAQQGRWAPADNATAKFILGAERQWQDANCDHNKITESILADDFLGHSSRWNTVWKSGGSKRDRGFVASVACVPCK